MIVSHMICQLGTLTCYCLFVCLFVFTSHTVVANRPLIWHDSPRCLTSVLLVPAGVLKSIANSLPLN